MNRAAQTTMKLGGGGACPKCGGVIAATYGVVAHLKSCWGPDALTSPESGVPGRGALVQLPDSKLPLLIRLLELSSIDTHQGTAAGKIRGWSPQERSAAWVYAYRMLCSRRGYKWVELPPDWERWVPECLARFWSPSAAPQRRSRSKRAVTA